MVRHPKFQIRRHCEENGMECQLLEFVFMERVQQASPLINWFLPSCRQARKAAAFYTNLRHEYEKLDETLPHDMTLDVEKFWKQQEVLDAVFETRKEDDKKLHIEDWERRRALRRWLLLNDRHCSACLKKPGSLKSTDCSVCGNFKTKIRFPGKETGLTIKH